MQIPGVRPPAEHAPPGNMHDGERLLREVKIGKQSLSLFLELSSHSLIDSCREIGTGIQFGTFAW